MADEKEQSIINLIQLYGYEADEGNIYVINDALREIKCREKRKVIEALQLEIFGKRDVVDTEFEDRLPKTLSIPREGKTKDQIKYKYPGICTIYNKIKDGYTTCDIDIEFKYSVIMSKKKISFQFRAMNIEFNLSNVFSSGLIETEMIGSIADKLMTYLKRRYPILIETELFDHEKIEEEFVKQVHNYFACRMLQGFQNAYKLARQIPSTKRARGSK